MRQDRRFLCSERQGKAVKLAENLGMIHEAIDSEFGENYARAHSGLVGLCLIAFVLEGQLSRVGFNLGEAGNDLATA
jgi:hypothetical protein